MQILGIIGKLNTGKSAIADVCQKYGYVQRSFADPLKEIVHQLFNVPRDVLWGSSEKRTGKVRQMLQELGTDYARKIDPDVWVNQMKSQLKRCRDLKYHGVVIPDARFLNEARLLRAEGATIIRVTRPNSGVHETARAQQHRSERESELIPAQWITHEIVNDGSLQDLQEKIKTILGDME